MLRDGVGGMSNAELLAIILRTGTPEMSALDVGKILMKKFKTLDALSEASVKEISELPGIGEIKAVEIKAALELGKRLMSSGFSDLGTVTCSTDVYKLYQGKLSKAKQEMFYVLLLNTKNRIVKEVLVSKGSLDTSLIHPREVFKEAIRESSASVIFVHNHPSGDPQPSRDDIAITHRLYETGEIIGIRVIDHIIIGRKSYYSFADNGLLRSK
ncbi:DNA repair protein RadC [Candidatus Sumerlaeota bacterium]|nr:DNA repair protein RadC [Candidatus Sumerlaeota bacterium]